MPTSASIVTEPFLDIAKKRSVGEPRSTQVDGVVAEAPAGSESEAPAA